MKFILHNKSGYQSERFFRELGYRLQKIDERTNEIAFIKSLTGDDFPRFHIYAKDNGQEIFCNIHLDQKKSSYGNHTAHSGEYEESDILDHEVMRLQGLASSME